MAVLNRQQKFLFIHIAKNGGTSVSQFLGKSDPLPSGCHKHSPARDFKAEMPDWDEYLTFAVIRDKVERFRSAYSEVRFASRKHPHIFDQNWLKRFLQCRSLEEFTQELLFLPPAPQSLFAPQEFFYANDNGDIIVKNLVPIENVSWEIPRLVGMPGQVGHVNKTGRKQEPLSEEAIRLIP